MKNMKETKSFQRILDELITKQVKYELEKKIPKTKQVYVPNFSLHPEVIDSIKKNSKNSEKQKDIEFPYL